jgi:hypothetical protein
MTAASEVPVLTMQVVQDFIDTFDRTDPTDRWIAKRLLERLHGELYRREREHFPEFVDLGGEA